MDDHEMPVASAAEAPLRRAFEAWAADRKTDAWKVNAAKHLRGWPIGAEVTEDEFNQAVYDACNHVIR